jgi:hypothetical protein
VPYVLVLFSASKQPKPVCCSSVWVLLTFTYAVSDVFFTLQGHTDLYRSLPLLPKIDHPDHLKPSVYEWLRINRLSLNPLTDEEGDDIDDDIPLADLLKKSDMSTPRKARIGLVVISCPAIPRD